MSISRFNAEGYHDPTAYAALTAIELEEKREARREERLPRHLVFICSPYAGDVAQNIKNARRYCRFAVKQGMIPFAPHLLYPQFLDDKKPEQRSLGMYYGLAWLRKCDQLWCFGTRFTAGMKKELQAARRRKLPIKFFDENMEVHHDTDAV